MIFKYQIGGVVYTPSSPTEYTTDPRATGQKVEKEQKNQFLTAPDVKEIIGKGLDNDTTYYINQINDIYDQYEQLTDQEKHMPHGRALAAELRGNYADLQSMNRRLEHFNKSYDLAKSNDGLLADAVTSNGFVVKSGDKVATVSFEQYANDLKNGRLNYTILTNEELAREREFNPELTNNTSVFDIIGNSKGINKIREDIQKIAAQATGENSEQLVNQGYLTSQQAAAMDSLIGGIQGGVYKSNEDIKESNNYQQLQLALSTMAQNLDRSSINTIKGQLIKNGSSPESLEDDFNDFLISLVMPRGKSESFKSSKIDLDAATSKSGSGSSGGTSDVDILESVRFGRGDIANLDFLSKGSAKIQTQGSILPKSVSVTESGEPVTVSKSKIRDLGIIDEAFTYNGEPIDPSRTVLTGTQYIAKMPVVINRSTGAYQIDKDGTEAFAEYNKRLKKEGLNIPEDQMTRAQKEKKKAIDYELEANNKAIEFKDFIVSEAVSSNKGDKFYWFDDRRDMPDIYREATGEENKMLEKALGSDHQAYSGINETTWSHLVFIPARGGQYFRSADNNALNVSKAQTELGAYTESKGARVMPRGDIQFFNK